MTFTRNVNVFLQVKKLEGKTTDIDTWTEGDAAEEFRFVMAWIVFPTYSLTVKDILATI